jgi:hypothetical protein
VSVNFITEATHPYSGGDPKVVFAIGRNQKQLSASILLNDANGISVHRVGKAILCL